MLSLRRIRPQVEAVDLKRDFVEVGAHECPAEINAASPSASERAPHRLSVIRITRPARRLVRQRGHAAGRAEEIVGVHEQLRKPIEERAPTGNDAPPEGSQFLIPRVHGPGSLGTAAADLLQERVLLLERPSVLEYVVQVDREDLAQRGVQQAPTLDGPARGQLMIGGRQDDDRNASDQIRQAIQSGTVRKGSLPLPRNEREAEPDIGTIFPIEHTLDGEVRSTALQQGRIRGAEKALPQTESAERLQDVRLPRSIRPDEKVHVGREVERRRGVRTEGGQRETTKAHGQSGAAESYRSPSAMFANLMSRTLHTRWVQLLASVLYLDSWVSW